MAYAGLLTHMPIYYFLLSHLLPLAEGPGSGVGHSVGAGSPFSDYTAAVAIYVFIIATLVHVLLIGAFLVLNLGLLSKRNEDHIGGRAPSDPGFLQSDIWPQHAYEITILPALEKEPEETVIPLRRVR